MLVGYLNNINYISGWFKVFTRFSNAKDEGYLINETPSAYRKVSDRDDRDFLGWPLIIASENEDEQQEVEDVTGYEEESMPKQAQLVVENSIYLEREAARALIWANISAIC